MFRLFISILITVFLSSMAIAQGVYKIRSGDTLKIEVLEDNTLNRTVLVLPDGNVSFPSVGTFRARGRSIEQVRQSLTGGLSSNFASPPNVHVSVENVFVPTPRAPRVPAKPATIDIFTMGEIGKPGALSAKPGTTILQAIAISGGLTKFAASKRIELRRTDKNGVEKIYQYNYKNPRAGNSIKSSQRLQSGDVIVVHARKLFE